MGKKYWLIARFGELLLKLRLISEHEARLLGNALFNNYLIEKGG